MSVVVFLGPTLPGKEAGARLDAIYLPPARQGDVYRAVRAHAPNAIGLIDGTFLDVPAVWHRELLWALSQGVHVFGAASMGALRAAELAPFGMRGIGRVFDAYRAGRWPGFDAPFEDDDEVAVIHAPTEAGGAALSDAMVDLRETLLAARAADVIDTAGLHRLTDAMKRLYFPERSFRSLAAAADTLLDNAAATMFRKWLADNRVSRKRLDALEMLDAMAHFLQPGPGVFEPGFRFEGTLVWNNFVNAAELREVPEQPASRVLEELRLDPHAWMMASRAALGRFQALQTDFRSDNNMFVEREFDTFRRQRGHWRRANFDAWLCENELDVAGFDRLLRDEARLTAAVEDQAGMLRQATIDHLRLSGAFSVLAGRVAAKAALLADRPGASVLLSGPAVQQALEWYFERHAVAPPRNIAEYAAGAGWPSEAEFARSVWHDYLFENAQAERGGL